MRFLRLSAFLLAMLPVFAGRLPFFTRHAQRYQKEEKSVILSYMKESKVKATLNRAAAVYSDKTENSAVVTILLPGAELEILRDYSLEWYLVKDAKSGRTGWVTRDAIVIPDDEPSNKEHMNKGQLESYVNIMGLKSDTKYLVLTDIDRQLTHVFKGSRYKWELERTMPCSTGKNESPTTRGLFKLSERGLWFYSERLGSGAKYWVRFNGSYLFHSVAMSRDQTVIDETIGERGSSGCVRLRLIDAEWFYRNVPDNTAVLIV